MFRYNPQGGQIKLWKLNKDFLRVKGSERWTGNERKTLKLDEFDRKCWLSITENIDLTNLGSKIDLLSH